MSVEIISTAILIIMVYLAIYCLIDRICKCCETCAAYKASGPAFRDFIMKKNLSQSLDEFQKIFKGDK